MLVLCSCPIVGSIVGLQMVNAKRGAIGLDIGTGLRPDTRAGEMGESSQVIRP